MRTLSLIIGTLVLLSFTAFINSSPHGKGFKVSCDDCHTSESWKVNPDSIRFNHDTTAMPLLGQHRQTECRQCHVSLVFTDAETECIACHTDMHQQTVGPDCSRCHTSDSWLVQNITQIHQQSRFPLIGPHANADCAACHPSESLLKFEPLGVECYDCHQADYAATTSPNHIEGGYSTNCSECHFIASYTWTGAGINHDFFPLRGGHEIADCNTCHTSGVYSAIPNTCISCHQQDYISTLNPSHGNLGFSTNCNECHTIDPGWRPAEFRSHDGEFFPIYSGKHNGEWNTCSDCHTNASNYGEFSCISCHEHNQGDTDDEHKDVSGYAYNSIACYACHPTGSGEGGFNHNTTNFPLTGAHTSTECLDCHTEGFANTSMICSDCHQSNYNNTINPNHSTISIPTTCETCHTTNPGWKPATFPTHNQYYQLNGAHASIANNCFDCHADNYNNSPNTCAGCHIADYNQTNNPPHASAQFSTECLTCHNETAWVPSTFNHDAQYFPIYSGKHNGEWITCSDCHTNASNYALFSCIDCHEHNKPDTDDKHNGIGGYAYNSEACFACHPTGDATGGFNHNSTAFPLTGSHTTTNCSDCHTNGYAGTTTICGDCHEGAYNQTSNPDHNLIGIPISCIDCHTTEPGWQPATFAIHNEYYQLNGAHSAISNDCATCHSGNYNSTPNTCVGCHLNNYNQTNDPPHASAQFPTECQTCHTENTWSPSTFNHDGQYFPIYSGKHNGEWNTCSDCHTNASTYAIFSCIDCHEHNQPDTDDNHQGVSGYAYNSEACFMCHPTGDGSSGFNHNSTAFPLTGSHSTTNCANCHTNGYAGTTMVCGDCHDGAYNQTSNPNHSLIGIPISCIDCHTTEPGWQPATFPIHNNYYPLTGGHSIVANDCAGCHNGNYNTTSSNCSDCHTDNYNQTSNPNHNSLNLSNDCASCHTTNPGWNPALFPDHNSYYVLQGAHIGINDCDQCHNTNYNSTPNTCEGCHIGDYNQTNNPPHASAQFPTDCETCHNQSVWVPSTFNHDAQYFPIYSGNHNGEWNTCSDCHTNPANYAQFSCIDCHEHNQSSMNSEHQGVSGYTYNSIACFNCHPNGNSNKKFNRQEFRQN